MSPDAELMLIFGALHLVALALGVVLLVMFLRSGDGAGSRPPEDDEPGGGGGNDRVLDRPPTKSPSGGIPLPDAEQAPIRLRGSDGPAWGRPDRRRVAEPDRPVRRRVRGSRAQLAGSPNWFVWENQRCASAHAGLRTPS